MRATRLVSVMLMAAAVAGCAGMRAKPKAMVSREGVLARGETLQYVGVDFTRTAFFDQYFRYDDLVKGKIPSWSQHALDDVSVKFPMPLTADIAIAEKRNAKIPESAVKTLPPDPSKWAINETLVRDEIAPWVDKKQSGHALLIVAEQLSKPLGVVAHYVVFDRRTGDIVLLDQVTAEAGGFGIHNYYLNGLKEVAKHAQKSLESIVR